MSLMWEVIVFVVSPFIVYGIISLIMRIGKKN